MSWPFSDYLIIPRRRVIVPVYGRDHFFDMFIMKKNDPLVFFLQNSLIIRQLGSLFNVEK